MISFRLMAPRIAPSGLRQIRSFSWRPLWALASHTMKSWRGVLPRGAAGSQRWRKVALLRRRATYSLSSRAVGRRRETRVPVWHAPRSGDGVLFAIALAYPTARGSGPPLACRGDALAHVHAEPAACDLVGGIRFGASGDLLGSAFSGGLRRSS